MGSCAGDDVCLEMLDTIGLLFSPFQLGPGFLFALCSESVLGGLVGWKDLSFEYFIGSYVDSFGWRVSSVEGGIRGFTELALVSFI